MTLETFFDQVKQYEKSNPDYAGLLYHISLYCDGDFLTLFEQAENEGKRLFLKTNTDFDDEPVIEINSIGLQ